MHCRLGVRDIIANAIDMRASLDKYEWRPIEDALLHD
jgi:hypothetical protein